MMLARLLRPRTVAVIGGRDAEQVIEQCDRFGFTGEVWPVSRRRDTLAGRRCYRSIEELPESPDAAFVGVNRHDTVTVVEALARAGAGGAVCYASGFSEAQGEQGAALQKALVEAAGAMPFIGPNCYGLINYLDGALLWPNQHGGTRLAPDARGVAIVMQSSNIAINLTMQRRALPIAYIITAGNQAQTGLSEIATGLLEDSRVSALGLYIEGFDDVAAFEQMATRARELRKPIAAIKVGRSEQARAATISHTASLAGADAAAGAFLRRLGVARVNSLPAFVETLKLLHIFGPLEGYDMSSMSCSGGEAALMADAAVGTRLRYRTLDERSAKALGAELGPLVDPTNPLDYHTFVWGDEAAMQRAFEAMIGAGFDLNLLVLDFPRTDRCPDDEWWPTLRAFQTALS
ncbi:MAG: CoA-binding protein, partial [Gammaproteobacteria bacterium]